ncbi:N-(5'-phosphoribosyl)anthranilate isomerase [Limimaricola sp.]|uniref:N-(5'-phosphoribosyl)anthranilate isomerase n=1 Tax=Limimaricola sp. TaxID=2211665 RepID=UPI004058E2DC
MRNLPAPMSPDHWLAHMFSAKSAVSGGVLRRSVRDVERYVGRAAFLAEMQRRGYSVIENAGQFVVFCNREPLRRLL